MSMSTQLPDAPVAPVGTPHAPPADKPKGWLTFLMVPAVGALFLWMIVPLAMTIYFSFIRFSLLNPDVSGFAKFDNYLFLSQDSSFYPALVNTLLIIGSVLAITVVFGVLLAVLYDREFFGKNVASLLVIAPFFVMPTVSALVWKNMIMPFAFLILFTSIKSLDTEQKEAAAIDGANPFQMFFAITLPHLQRSIGVVVMIETIFLLSIFAEIYTTTSGGPGHSTTNLAYLVYSLGLQQFDVGIASAGGILAVIMANVVAFFLVRMMAQNLKGR